MSPRRKPPRARLLDERVRRYYLGYDEEGRLGRDPFHHLEFDTTLRYLERALPVRGHILDAGGGPGRYAVALARRGFNVSLIDLMPEHVEAARRAAARAGVAHHLLDLRSGSLDDLSFFPDSGFAGVLCLGSALGHLVDPVRRTRALRELFRVARPGAPVFVSVIGRLSLLSSSMLANPREWQLDPAMYRRIERTGDYDGQRGFAPCHFFLVDELQEEMRQAGLRIEVTVGLQGLVPPYPKQIASAARRYPKAFRAWRELLYRSCEDPAVVPFSQHFLVIGRRPGGLPARPEGRRGRSRRVPRTSG